MAPIPGSTDMGAMPPLPLFPTFFYASMFKEPDGFVGLSPTTARSNKKSIMFLICIFYRLIIRKYVDRVWKPGHGVRGLSIKQRLQSSAFVVVILQGWCSYGSSSRCCRLG